LLLFFCPTSVATRHQREIGNQPIFLPYSFAIKFFRPPCFILAIRFCKRRISLLVNKYLGVDCDQCSCFSYLYWRDAVRTIHMSKDNLLPQFSGSAPPPRTLATTAKGVGGELVDGWVIYRNPSTHCSGSCAGLLKFAVLENAEAAMLRHTYLVLDSIQTTMQALSLNRPTYQKNTSRHGEIVDVPNFRQRDSC